MKAFLQHDQSGLFYGVGDQWVANTAEAIAFESEQDAVRFRDKCRAVPSHPVRRLDPAIYQRFSQRAPGIFQSGE